MKLPNRSGITFEYDTDEHGAVCVVVIGPDYDSVLAAALDVKNAQPVADCPEVGAVLHDIGNGSWSAVVRTRRAAS